jgi:hypothetical protein
MSTEFPLRHPQGCGITILHPKLSGWAKAGRGGRISIRNTPHNLPLAELQMSAANVSRPLFEDADQQQQN